MAQAMIDYQTYCQYPKLNKAEKEKDMQTLLDTFSEEIRSKQDQDFFQDDNDVKKKAKIKSDYSNTKVKARNLLTNVSYRRYKQKVFNNASFITDILSVIVQNFKSIGLDRKFEIENERLYVKMLWGICLLHAFTFFIYLKQNYSILSSPNLTYQKANDIVKKYIKEDTNNINILKIKLEEKFKIIHFIYSSLYPKVYNRVNIFGTQNKSNFDFTFSN